VYLNDEITYELDDELVEEDEDDKGSQSKSNECVSCVDDE
jgi:hypothetical protein